MGDANLNGTGNGLNNDTSAAGQQPPGGGAGTTPSPRIGPVGGDDTLIGGSRQRWLNGGVGNDVMQAASATT